MMSAGSFYKDGQGAELLARLSVAANDQHDWEALLSSLLRFVRRSFSMEVAFISEFQNGRRYFRHINADELFCPIEVDGSDPLDDSYCKRIVNKELPGLIIDACQLPLALEIPATRSLPIGTHLSVPIVLNDGSIYGTFCCFSRDVVLDIGHRDLEFMQLMAALVGRFISADVLYARQRQSMIQRLRQFMESRAIEIALQPVFRLQQDDDQIRMQPYAQEALARFRCPQQGGSEDECRDGWLDDVESVFHDATEVGMAVPLELKCLKLALARLPLLAEGELLSVNLSAAVLCSKECSEFLLRQSLDRLVIEITEREAVALYSDLVFVLDRLRAAGARVAVDDAGAGYASMKHVLVLKPDWIKLDRSLVASIHLDHEQQAMVRSLVGYAAEVGSLVIAEGLESSDELRCVYDLGVRYGQGYLLQKPRLSPLNDDKTAQKPTTDGGKSS